MHAGWLAWLAGWPGWLAGSVDVQLGFLEGCDHIKHGPVEGQRPQASGGLGPHLQGAAGRTAARVRA